MNKQQTAVEWLFNEITLEYVAKGNLSFMDIVNMSQQAKEMEKERLEKAYDAGNCDGHDACYGHGATYQSFDDYYEETYGGNK
jgi:hypothetical protein